jgi:hypothetical protein
LGSKLGGNRNLFSHFKGWNHGHFIITWLLGQGSIKVRSTPVSTGLQTHPPSETRPKTSTEKTKILEIN